jgi:hypothetical protein
MREVTRDEFYAVIMPLNVHPVPEGRYPYTSNFKTPDGRIIGKVVGRFTNPPNGYPIITEYFLMEKS